MMYVLVALYLLPITDHSNTMAVSFQEFSSKTSCESAITAIREKQKDKKFIPPSKPEYICVPK